MIAGPPACLYHYAISEYEMRPCAMRYEMENITTLAEQKTPVSSLIIGMYVANLDRPWRETPFPLQGILIRSVSDIRKISEYCDYVYIDLIKSTHIKNGHGETNHPRVLTNFQQWKAKHCQQTYKVTASFKHEITTAKKVIDKVFHKFETLLSKRTHLSPTHLSDLNEVAHDMVESVLRNPDAMAWLCRVREFRSPIYLHGIRLSVWGCICGRQLGLNQAELHRLTTALILSCIGKSFLSQNMLNQYSITDNSYDSCCIR